MEAERWQPAHGGTGSYKRQGTRQGAWSYPTWSESLNRASSLVLGWTGRGNEVIHRLRPPPTRVPRLGHGKQFLGQ